MHFNSVLAVSATLFALGLAADPLAFTSWPKDVQAGKPVTLTWAGAAPDQPVTLTLRKGSAGNLSDVEVMTAQGKDGTFTWTPGKNVKEGQTYAFQVSQGGQRNYSALLKAGAPVPSVSDTTEDGTTATGTTASGTSATSDATTTTTGTSTGTSSGTTTDTTTGATQTTGITSKPLISSAASATPSSSPASTSVVSSTVTSDGPMMTDESTHKKAKHSAGVQNAASPLQYSMNLIGGALGLLVYLVQ
ncbi:hypothetical protein N7448_004194 [Penicillium atrosanguineum]|uniref:Yeast cell wall synthesis Kre9/Knh1-like N-terminal domain-containing protein n=1 Tax=Penicillium atrosanguineum TaxID=1132637 RepID=A0A9W9H952_9EURO|nr:uncharacterized protein N7443_003160 [Penicillium atrosanguineum]KAJ5117256.1 hypothetical protein N7526_011365 [Penicillium atrosanguineum]KAJ5140786.1 hypothetical protein N7448_004194 [Penicillium atrosanguineum]KAJ5310699.1 hypothetical protein N7443_003160 [Penicillium atrosanguineum]KAJ5316221.1 hypothetical protein N7476_006528 [Penicillium atrosanguineum]